MFFFFLLTTKINYRIKINDVESCAITGSNVLCNKYIEKQNEYNPVLTAAKYFTNWYMCTHIDWDVK